MGEDLIVATQTGEFTLAVNGKAVTAVAEPNGFLLNYLRDELQLTGSKNGCSTGHCGACMVLIDGAPMRSCLVKMKNAAGKKVETIESLYADGTLHPIQEAFVASGGTQCGFCTPGFVMATRALLEKNPNPTRAEIEAGLKENICRCTGYVKIFDAVQLAAQVMLEPSAALASPAGGGLGNNVKDIDGIQKVCGTLPYADDIYEQGMCHGKILLAAYPHAEIVSLDVEAARQVTGVVAVLTHKDVPVYNGFGPIKQDQPVFAADRVRMMGDPVALVVAETEKAAEAARKLIKVEYRELEGVFTMERALEPDAPKLHAEGNVCKHLIHEIGDIEGAFAKADLVMEGHFETPWVEHAYLEPEAGLGHVESDGTVVVRCGTQFPFEVRMQISKILGLPEEKVRVIATPVGGGFGSKCDATIEPMLAVAAHVTGRTVKITLTREESLKMSTKRHPYHMDYRVAFARDGHLLGVKARLLSDAGPYSDLSPRVIDQACIFAAGPYRVPNVWVEGYALFTNNVRSSAFRGFGINQVAFSIESIIDDAARQLGIDPFDIRELNALTVGDKTASGELLKASVAIRATIREARDKIREAAERYRAEAAATGKKIGIGIAAGFKNVGAGKGKVDDAGAILELHPEGKIRMRISCVDMGQGIRTALHQIAVEATGISSEGWTVITGDTSLTPKHGGAVGERQTLISGNAAKLAGEAFRKKVLDYTGEFFGENPETLTVQGQEVVEAATGRVVTTLSELHDRAAKHGQTVQASYYYVAPKTYALADQEARRTVPSDQYRNYPAYAYAAQAAVVEVDEKTGKVKLLHVVASHDVGRVINRQKIDGQLEGSVSMGQGYALTEDFPMENGRPKVKLFGKLGLPEIAETPVVETVLVEDPEPNGPYGAKGISEVATVPITPAITNAIRDAVGVRITVLPATPARVLAALAERDAATAADD